MRRDLRKARGIMDDVYEKGSKVEWSESSVMPKINGVIDEIVGKLESKNPRHGLLMSFGYGVMHIADEIKAEASFQFLKNPRKVAFSEPAVLQLTYRNIMTLEVKVLRGKYETARDIDEINPWICFPASAVSMEEAMTEEEFARNIIDLLKNVYRPKFQKWALRAVRDAYDTAGEVPLLSLKGLRRRETR